MGGDVLKGALTAGAGWAVGGRPLGFACGGAAVVGHIFPVFRRFRGGKGVATGAGVVMVLLPLVAVCCAVAFLIVLKVSHRASVASIVMAALVPLLALAVGRPAWEVLTCAAFASLVLLRHWSNIQRLVSGREPAVGLGDEA